MVDRRAQPLIAPYEHADPLQAGWRRRRPQACMRGMSPRGGAGAGGGLHAAVVQAARAAAAGAAQGGHRRHLPPLARRLRAACAGSRGGSRPARHAAALSGAICGGPFVGAGAASVLPITSHPCVEGLREAGRLLVWTISQADSTCIVYRDAYAMSFRCLAASLFSSIDAGSRFVHLGRIIWGPPVLAQWFHLGAQC